MKSPVFRLILLGILFLGVIARFIGPAVVEVFSNARIARQGRASVSTLTAAVNTPAYKQAMQEGLTATRARRPAQAVIAYTKAVAAAPSEPQPLLKRGDAYQSLKKYHSAVQDYSAALACIPRDKQAAMSAIAEEILAARGKANYVTAAYAQSVADYRQAIALGTEKMEIREALATELATCPDPQVRNGKQAIELAQKLLDGTVRSDTEEYSKLLAMAYAADGQYDKALQSLQPAIDKLQAQLREWNGYANDPQMKKRIAECQAMKAAFQAKKPWIVQPKP